MNAFSDILDINLLLFKEGDLCSPLSAFEPPKGNGLVQKWLLSHCFHQQVSNLGCLLIQLRQIYTKKSVKLTSSQSLPSSQASSQSQFNNINANHLGVTLNDVGNIGEAGNLLCLILGLLFAVPAGVVAKPTSWPHLMWG
ncbi:hypothetical protein DSO57_1014039 [Entomophthora muscae]|uniref:Uncharacterized protein n=1 Tax=Entomophthora muscae TaxID=34485 RepID=A0ACC2U3K8_9FUNG|nr:hypothetical protein DSO57_1014039 [Entomophthora muscae]